MLEEFESEIKWKKRLVGRYNLELDNIQLHCSSLRSAVGWTQGMLDLLYKHLEKVYQKSGAKFSRKRSRSDDLIGDMYYELVEMHGSCNLIDEQFENITTVVGIPSLEPIGPEIHYGFIKYEITPVKDKAFAILQQMAKLDDMMEKKGAGEGLDPSISKHYLEEQIKLVMELPVREVCEEATNIIPVVLSVPYKQLLVREASSFIFGTSRDIIRERDSFWQQFLKRPSSGESKEPRVKWFESNLTFTTSKGTRLEVSLGKGVCSNNWRIMERSGLEAFWMLAEVLLNMQNKFS